MKSQTLIIVALLVVMSCLSAQAGFNEYDYCGKPCNDPPGIVCAYNQICFQFFTTKCEMKNSNCNMGTNFNEAAMSSCLMGRKC